jgi:hypothetical protein
MKSASKSAPAPFDLPARYQLPIPAQDRLGRGDRRHGRQPLLPQLLAQRGRLGETKGVFRRRRTPAGTTVVPAWAAGTGAGRRVRGLAKARRGRGDITRDSLPQHALPEVAAQLSQSSASRASRSAPGGGRAG